MSGGSRRLSLRARMLVLLVCVTTAFLLIMGTVSTVALARHVSAQFAAGLKAESTYGPGEIARHPGGYAAITVIGGQVQPLTSGSASRALVSAISQIVASGQLRSYLGDRPDALPSSLGGTRLTIVARRLADPLPPRSVNPISSASCLPSRPSMSRCTMSFSLPPSPTRCTACGYRPVCASSARSCSRVVRAAGPRS